MTSSQNGSLVGLWVVERLLSVDGSLTHPVAGSTIEMLFDGDGKVMGNAGCNSYRGSAEIDGETMTFGPLATTQRLCLRPLGVMDQEARFLESLARTARYSLGEDGTLTLVDGSDTPITVMSRRDETPTELVV